MDYRDIRLRTAKLKKEKGASSVVLLIMFFILMGVALIVAFMQWRNQKVRILQVQDSLAASVLAASVPEAVALAVTLSAGEQSPLIYIGGSTYVVSEAVADFK